MKKLALLLLLFQQTLSAQVKREDLQQEDRWNLEALYPSKEAWQQDFNSIKEYGYVNIHRGKLHKSPQNLKTTLDAFYNVKRKHAQLYDWAHRRKDEDLANAEAKALSDAIAMLCSQFSEQTAWLIPEILALPNEQIEEYLNSPELGSYRFLLQKIFRQKSHTLSDKEEALFELTTSPYEANRKAFYALTNAEIRFAKVADSQDVMHELTHATFKNFILSPDRILRKNAYLLMHQKFMEHEKSLTELLLGTIKAHLVAAKARGYPSSLEAALQPNGIDAVVYTNLIETVHNRLSSLHRYIALRKKVLQLDKLHCYDLFVPLVPNVDKKYSYNEAECLVLESVSPLGSDYVQKLKNGLQVERWVDRYETQNKRSGAYSAGSYDSMPYILMNYTGTLMDVFTLAHEAGHSMHTLYSNKQPYHYADYPIFVAEVASTFNEELLRHHFLKNAVSNRERAFLLNQKIDNIRSALFQQTLLAEFELYLHTQVEKSEPFTADHLKTKYLELMQLYYGPDLQLNLEVGITWARIPHFYSNYYVYQYATGIAASLTLSDALLAEEEGALRRYIAFLSAGSSNYPLHILAEAGVDMRSPQPIINALNQFDADVAELERLLAKDYTL